MPSMYVPDDVAEPWILDAGGFEEAKEEMVATLRERAPEVDDG